LSNLWCAPRRKRLKRGDFFRYIRCAARVDADSAALSLDRTFVRNDRRRAEDTGHASMRRRRLSRSRYSPSCTPKAFARCRRRSSRFDSHGSAKSNA